jgi:hypothetical protein
LGNDEIGVINEIFPTLTSAINFFLEGCNFSLQFVLLYASDNQLMKNVN